MGAQCPLATLRRMNLSQAVNAFLDYKLYFRRVRPQSIKTYSAHLNRFSAAVGPSTPLNGAINRAEPFLIEMSRRGRSDAYVRKAFFVVRNFAAWSCAKGYARSNPLHDAKAPMLHDRQKVFLTRAQVASLLTAIRRSGQIHRKRDHALVSTLYYALFRISEALNARPEDFDLTSCNVRVFGKGGKARMIPFHPNLVPILRGWLRERPKDSPLLFPSGGSAGNRAPGQLGQSRVGLVLRTIYGPAAGLGKKVSPHVLRRSGADHLYNKGADLGQLKGLLRHNSVNTTMTYLQVETPANLRGAWKKL